MKKFYILFFLPLWICAQSVSHTAIPDSSLTDQAKTEGNATDAKTAAREKLEAIRQRVLSGESMSNLATLYSDDKGSVKSGGLYMNVARGQFVPEFESAAFNLTPGEISEIFETKFGLHFVQLVAHHGDMIDVRHILIKPK